MRVYLSGPISGKSYDEAMDWRDRVEARLSSAGFEVRNPLRGKSYLSNQGSLDSHKYGTNPTLSDKALKKRDVMDVVDCDIILVNFTDATQVSIGSVYEMAIGDFLHKLIIMVAPKTLHPHDHPFLRDASVIFNDLDAAVQYIESCSLGGPEA